MTNPAVIGLFDFEDDTVEALAKLRDAGFDDLTTQSPVSSERIDIALDKKHRYVGRFTLAGALLGALFGFLLPAIASVLYPQPQGGMPVISLPPYALIAVEMAILFGMLFTIGGFFILSGLPTFRSAPYSIETGEDKFAIVLAEADDRILEAKNIMRSSSAVTVEEIEIEAPAKAAKPDTDNKPEEEAQT